MNQKKPDTRTKIGLVQINNSFSGQNYLPLSAGMLQAYAERHLERPDDFQFLLPIYSRVSVKEAVTTLLDSDLVFFSTYVWNIQISLAIAQGLKAHSPEIVTVFGGPQVPRRADGFLREHPFVNIAVRGEGEQTALALLENLEHHSWEQAPGISYLRQDGSVAVNPDVPRMSDLEYAPSPYLEGVFEPLMRANPQESWIALWETNRGCPFSCTFCDWGSAVQSKVHPFDVQRLYREVEWFAGHQIEYIFCCDANFGILPRDVDIARFVARTKESFGYPHALSVQNTKNATERAYTTQKILSDAGLNKGVDIGLQSTDPATLKAIKRSNISLETYKELQRRFTKDRVETYTDVIIGLPGETYDSFTDGVSSIIENGQHNRIQFNNLSILPNAEMGDLAYQKRHGIATVESKTINVHGALAQHQEDIDESQLLVVSTDTLPPGDWVKARVFSWWAGLLHFDKVLQIPLTIAHAQSSMTYRHLIESFCQDHGDSYPVLQNVHSLLTGHARGIQTGGPEYVKSEAWLNIWWPVDEYALIDLCVQNRLDEFYVEAEALLARTLDEAGHHLPKGLLSEAAFLNLSLLKLPFQTEDLDVDLSYDLWGYYRAIVSGEPAELKGSPSRYHIDRTTTTWDSWSQWCREVIWYGNKRGAYLYGNDHVEPQLSGHF